VNRSLTLARGARRRGNPRETYCVTDGNFLWRISAAAQRLKALLDIQEGGARTAQTVMDLTHLEYRVEQMLRTAQLAAIRAALPEEERTACDG
jgi:hypothetical protein